MITKKRISYNGQSVFAVFDEPHQCPLCKYAIMPEPLHEQTYTDEFSKYFYSVLYLCPHCYRTFVAQYAFDMEKHHTDGFHLKCLYVAPDFFVEKTFDAHIKDVSPAFVEIYNQALAAESNSLDQIAGIGYRKALEFLIKDYLIHKEPEEADAIKAMALGNCISQKIESEHLKTAASRCAWLGNDQTHYVQKYEEYDISDLKRLIEVTAHWIQMDLLTEEAAQIEHRGR